MMRRNVRRVVTTLSFLAVVVGGATAPAMSATSDSAMPACWWSRCQGQL